jgi:hypothetical protein
MFHWISPLHDQDHESDSAHDPDLDHDIKLVLDHESDHEYDKDHDHDLYHDLELGLGLTIPIYIFFIKLAHPDPDPDPSLFHSIPPSYPFSPNMKLKFSSSPSKKIGYNQACYNSLG